MASPFSFSGGGRVRGGRAVDVGWFKFSEEATDRIMSELLRPLAEEIANEGAQVAYDIAPKRTGKMADSIRSGAKREGNTMTAYLTVGGPGIEYWQYVEYGTGTLGENSAKAPGSKTGLSSQGYKHGGSTGMPARPFMRPALLAMRALWKRKR